jgi:hypothetical protein
MAVTWQWVRPEQSHLQPEYVLGQFQLFLVLPAPFFLTMWYSEQPDKSTSPCTGGGSSSAVVVDTD